MVTLFFSFCYHCSKSGDHLIKDLRVMMTSFEQNCKNSRKPGITSGSTGNTSRFGQILSESMVWVIYLWSKVVCFVLFCFVLRSPKPVCFMLCSWYLQKAFYEYGCTNVVGDCLELLCGGYWLLNHFLNEN